MPTEQIALKTINSSSLTTTADNLSRLKIAEYLHKVIST